MSDYTSNVKALEGARDLGRALGRDVPHRLQNVRSACVAIVAASTSNKTKGK